MLVIFHTYCQEKKAKLKLQSEQIIHLSQVKWAAHPPTYLSLGLTSLFLYCTKNSSFTVCLFKERFSYYLVFGYLVFSSAVQIVFLVHLNEMVIFEETVSVSY